MLCILFITTDSDSDPNVSLLFFMTLLYSVLPTVVVLFSTTNLLLSTRYSNNLGSSTAKLNRGRGLEPCGLQQIRPQSPRELDFMPFLTSELR